MEFNPTVSFVIPMYNSENYIENCVNSILKQTSNSYEIIIIDDGSKDKSLDICREYEKKHKNIYVYSQENQGVSIARNNGIKKARGKWIVFVDSDDEVLSNYVELILEHDKNDEYDLFLFDYIIMGNQVREEDTTEVQVFNNLQKLDLIRSSMLNEKSNSIFGNVSLRSPWAKAYRRSFLLKEKICFLLGVKMGEDMIFNINSYFKMRKMCYIKRKVYLVQERQDSVSRSYIADMDIVDRKFYMGLKELFDKYKVTEDIWRLYYEEAFIGIMRCMKYQYFNSKSNLTYSETKQKLNKLLKLEPYIKAVELVKNGKCLRKKIIGYLLSLKWFYTLKIIYNIKE